MIELCKYSLSQRGEVIRAINQICDTEGHEVSIVYEEHNGFTTGYEISNGGGERHMFLIDDPTGREQLKLWASEGMQGEIRDRVSSASAAS